MTDEWTYFDPDVTKKYMILEFDDGNDTYKYYTNEWFLIGRWRGKVSLRNAHNDAISIRSISEWKTLRLQSK